MPELGEEADDVIEVRLTGRGVDDGLERDAEKRQCEDEDEHPEDEPEHGRRIIQ